MNTFFVLLLLFVALVVPIQSNQLGNGQKENMGRHAARVVRSGTEAQTIISMTVASMSW